MSKDIIPFNSWSREKIKAGRKHTTARHRKYLHDPRVVAISEKMPWWIIRKYFYKLEGAYFPGELQTVIEGIYHRHVPDGEMFYLHFLGFGEWKKLEVQNNA